MIKVLFINNRGGGFSEEMDVEPGTTAGELFVDQMGDVDPGDYLIRVNREIVPSTLVLSNGDKMTVTPTKITGA